MQGKKQGVKRKIFSPGTSMMRWALGRPLGQKARSWGRALCAQSLGGFIARGQGALGTNNELKLSMTVNSCEYLQMSVDQSKFKISLLIF